MDAAQVLTNILAVVLFIGGPIIPLLLLAGEIGHWHAANPDPEFPNDAHEH